MSDPMSYQGERKPPEPGSYADGYNEGRTDLLYGLKQRSPWALDLVRTAWPWRPIETAPRDEKRIILVWRPTAASDMRRMSPDFWRNGVWWHSRPDEQPTHWMHFKDIFPAAARGLEDGQ